MVIQIQISDETWEYLKDSKRIRETFDDVIKRLIKETGFKENDNKNTKN